MSKAQWRWMYATHKTFAHRWAHKTMARRGGPRVAFRSLPTRTGGPSARTAR